jgi:integrase
MARRKQLSLALASRSEWTTVTLGELLDRFAEAKRKHGVADGTARTYRDRMSAIARVTINGRSAADLPLEQLTEPIAQAICDGVAETAPVIAKRATAFASKAWQWGTGPARALIPVGSVNPWVAVDAPPRSRPQVPEISAEVMRALWAACDVVEHSKHPHPQHRIHPQPINFIRCLMLDGLRPWSEALPMECSQLFKSRGRWAIRLVDHKTKRKSGTKVRSLGTRAAAILLAQRDAVGGRGPLWPPIGKSQGGLTMDDASVKRAFKLIVAEASKHVDVDPRLYVYCLRHGFATSALEAGATLTEVQAALGHDNVESTLHYLQTLPGLEGQTADRVALHVIDGISATIEDLAREVGCEPSIAAVLAAVKRANQALGVSELREVEQMNVEHYEATKPSSWNHKRFLAACKARGIERDEPTKLALLANITRQSADRYLNNERDPDAPTMIKLADKLGVRLDWLVGRDTAQTSQEALG